MRSPLRSFLPAVACACAFLLASCSGTGATTADLTTTADLVSYLDSEGVTLQEFGPVVEPAFTGQGTRYNVIGGGTLFLFEYDSASAASLDATRVDGADLGMAGPKVYQEGPLVAVYAGSDIQVETALASVLGRIP